MAAVCSEYLAGLRAVALLLERLARDPNFLDGDELRPKDAMRLAANIEATCLVRLFAEFEAGLRSYWGDGLHRETRPPASDLIDAVGATQDRPELDHRTHRSPRISQQPAARRPRPSRSRSPSPNPGPNSADISATCPEAGKPPRGGSKETTMTDPLPTPRVISAAGPAANSSGRPARDSPAWACWTCSRATLSSRPPPARPMPSRDRPIRSRPSRRNSRRRRRA